MSTTQKNKTTKTTAIAKPEKSIYDAIEVLNKKIELFGNISDSKYKTSGIIPGYKNIKEEIDVQTLIKAAGAILSSQEAYLKGANVLGRTTFPAYTIDGSLVEDILHDINLRVNIITHQEEIENLKSLQKRAESFLTEEEKKEAFFKELAAKLGEQ